MKSVLTIAGHDPSSGAGVTADLKVFAAHGLFGTSAITALTVQSTTGVRSVHPVEAAVLGATLECLHSDMPPAGIKIGMLATAAQVEAVCLYLEAVRATDAGQRTPVVLDPVVRSSSGRELLDGEGLELVKSRLLSLVDWVTPNVEEVSILSGVSVMGRGEVPAAARRLQDRVSPARGGRALGVLVTGGHLDPPDDFLLTGEGEGIWLEGTRIVTRATHGTGCALSSAFMSELVIGHSAPVAAAEAKEYVLGAMRNGKMISSGAHPMNHLWRFPEV